MVEYTYVNESYARAARRWFINRGSRVSLLGYDPARNVYVFDVLG